MTFKLTEQQVKNLTAFLSRVQIAGHEAEEFVAIVTALKHSYEEGTGNRTTGDTQNT